MAGTRTPCTVTGWAALEKSAGAEPEGTNRWSLSADSRLVVKQESVYFIFLNFNFSNDNFCVSGAQRSD